MSEPYTLMHTVDAPGQPLDFRVYPFKIWGDIGKAIIRAREIAAETPYATHFVVMPTGGKPYEEDVW